GKRVTLGGDKNYDTREFVRELRGMNITPHVAQNLATAIASVRSGQIARPYRMQIAPLSR
ncbi:MAG: hypothetical protein WBX16_26820, partial [Candidatus Acidiferrales bacterium]